MIIQPGPAFTAMQNARLIGMNARREMEFYRMGITFGKFLKDHGRSPTLIEFALCLCNYEEIAVLPDTYSKIPQETRNKIDEFVIEYVKLSPAIEEDEVDQQQSESQN